MGVILGAARGLGRFGLWFGGALILLAALLIGVDIGLRAFFATSIGGADELAGYALAIGTVWSLGGALLDRAHIRIDSLYVFFPPRLRIVLDLVAIVLFVGFFAMMGWHGLGVFELSWVSGSRSQSGLETPLVIPQALWLAGFAVFIVIGVVLLAASIERLLAGDRPGARRLISSRSAEEEVEEEMRAAEARKAETLGP